MREPTLDAVLADRAYDVLVRYAGAVDDARLINRADFVVAQARGCSEYRFMGRLGFGGKFRHDPHRRPSLYVDCYPEDMNDERRVVIDMTNAALADLLAESAA